MIAKAQRKIRSDFFTTVHVYTCTLSMAQRACVCDCAEEGKKKNFVLCFCLFVFDADNWHQNSFGWRYLMCSWTELYIVSRNLILCCSFTFTSRHFLAPVSPPQRPPTLDVGVFNEINAIDITLTLIQSLTHTLSSSKIDDFHWLRSNAMIPGTRRIREEKRVHQLELSYCKTNILVLEMVSISSLVVVDWIVVCVFNRMTSNVWHLDFFVYEWALYLCDC